MSPQNTPGPCGHASYGGNFASSAAKPESAGCAVEALAVALAVAPPVVDVDGAGGAELASGAESNPTTTLTAPLFPAPAALRLAPAELAASSPFGALFGASQPYCATSRSSAGARGRRGGSKELQASRRWEGEGRALLALGSAALGWPRWDGLRWEGEVDTCLTLLALGSAALGSPGVGTALGSAALGSPALGSPGVGSPGELDVLLSLDAHPLPIDRRIQQNVHFERPSLRTKAAMRTKSGGCGSSPGLLRLSARSKPLAWVQALRDRRLVPRKQRPGGDECARPRVERGPAG